MGLDVGVVKITYLDRPPEPMYDFLVAVATSRLGEDWGGKWAGNAFMEFRKRSLVQRADTWAKRNGLGREEHNELRRWVKELPWDGNSIMLHLNW